MKLLVCILAQAAALAYQATALDPEYESYKKYHERNYRSVSKEDSWNNFKAQHAKNYTSAKQESLKKATFFRNLERIHGNHEKFEKGQVSHFLGVNRNADQPDGGRHATGAKTNEAFNNINTENVIGGLSDDLPDNFDWNAQGMVTRAQNQGGCSSCWTFSATGVLESQARIKKGDQVFLSKQQLLNCFQEGQGIPPCSEGGDPREAFYWLSQQPSGSVTEDSFPYSNAAQKYPNGGSTSGTCVRGTPAVKVYKWGQLSVPATDVDVKSYLKTNGPLAVNVETNLWPGSDYTGGIINAPRQGPPITKEMNYHSILLVGWGYDQEMQQEYWIIKNSWGDWWGNKGFGKLGMGEDKDSGLAQYMLAYGSVVDGTGDDSMCAASGETCKYVINNNILTWNNCCNSKPDVLMYSSGLITCKCK